MSLLRAWTTRSPAENFDAALRACCAVVVVFFGCWTILAEAFAISGHSYGALWRFSWLAPVAAVAILAFFVVTGAPRTALTAEEADPKPVGKTRLLWPWMLVGSALAAIFAFANQYMAFWFLAVLCLGVGYWSERAAPEPRIQAARNNLPNYVAFAIAVLLGILAALLLNRPTLDQTLGIDAAVMAMDHPGAGIYATDGLHGIRGAYGLPTYLAQTYELLAARIAGIFGVAEPIVVFDLVLGPVFALFSVLAAALCLRRLLPHHWGWASLAYVALLLVLRETYITYGNFAYVRMFEGKSIFLTALIPLIVLYAIEFFTRPTVGGWILLLLAQVSAMGMTANSLYAAPLAAGFALAACWRPSWAATRKLALGLLTCMYPVAIALTLRAVLMRAGLSLEDFHDFIPIDAATKLVLGDAWGLWLWLFALTCSWCLIDDAGVRRWVVGFCFGFVLLCLNPFLDKYWGQYVTAKYLTWRLFWALPLPLFLSLFVTQGLAGAAERTVQRKWIAAALAFSLVLVAAISQPWIDPTVRLSSPFELKVPHPQYEVAARLNEIAGDAKAVLASEEVSAWVPTFRHHAYPLVARGEYTIALLTVFANSVDTVDVQERLTLAAYVDGLSVDDKGAEDLLAHRIQTTRLYAVAVPDNFARMTQITQILEGGGYTRAEYEGYTIFSR